MAKQKENNDDGLGWVLVSGLVLGLVSGLVLGLVSGLVLGSVSVSVLGLVLVSVSVSVLVLGLVLGSVLVSVSVLVLVSVSVLVLGLVSGSVSVSVLVLVSGLFLVLVLGSVSEEELDKYFGLFILFYLIGAVIGGYIGYQQTQINALQANSIGTTTIPNSYYEGTIQAIYTNNPSYVQFTSGAKYQGNLTRISNLGIGADCKLLLNQSVALGQGTLGFTSGACK